MSTETLHSGRFVRLMRRGTWEYAERTNAQGIVVVVAVTAAGELLLIEQHRPPVDATVIELPAGLSGDESPDEPLAHAAARELEEETGYVCDEMVPLGEAAPSAGLVSEVYSFFLARGLRRASAGGGVAGEAIDVRLVPLAEVPAYLRAAEARGVRVAVAVYAALGFLALSGTPVTP